jgi:hypothetical protein
MERLIKNEVALPKTVQCMVFGKDLSVINCQHWSANVNECTSVCRINAKENPSIADCAACTHRKTFEGMKKIVYDESSNEIQILNIDQQEIKAETSQLIEGKVSEEIFEKRKAICISCQFLVKTAKNAKDSIGWCKGGCGCTVGNPRAALSQKLYMPSLSCPKGKFKKEEGKGFNAEDAKDSANGFIQSVVNLFKK